MTHETPLKDDIIHGIVISAPIEKVWEIVSTPGWWILDETIAEHRVERVSDTSVIVHDDKWGAFPIGIEEMNAPQRAVFTWSPDEKAPTLRVAFSLESVAGGTELEVHETGFAAMTEEEHSVHLPANIEGWIVALKAASAAATR